MQPAEVVRAVVGEQLGQVRAAIFTGSVAEGRATEHSDLDVVVLIAGEPAPYRQTLRSHGWLLELFVHDDESIERFFGLDRERGTCTLATMIASGHVVAGDGGVALQAAARSFIEAGPASLDTEQLDRRRYMLTDALDDLLGARDDDERDMVAVQVLRMAADLHLAARQHWGGNGKWLLRQLRDCDPDIASTLVEGHRAAVAAGDVSLLVQTCDQILLPLGGRLREGYRVGG